MRSLLTTMKSSSCLLQLEKSPHSPAKKKKIKIKLLEEERKKLKTTSRT